MKVRRYFIIASCCIFLFSVAAPVSAVDKKEKKATSSKVKKTVSKKTAKGKTVKKGTSGKRKYDTFIDRNKNGIDDRAEKLKKTAPQKKAVKKKSKKVAKSSKSKKPAKKP